MHPVLFQPFGFPIYSYSIVLIVSFIATIQWGIYLGRRRGPLDPERIYELAIGSIMWGLLGGRLLYVVQHPEKYMAEPWQILNLREGGMTILGGILLPVAVMFITARRRGWDARNVLDTYAAPVFLGMAIGRIGCVLHGCCYGDVCDANFPLALTYPNNPGMPAGPRYPSQLFEAFADLVLMGFLIWFTPRIKFAGQALWAGLAGYGLIRFLNEFVRADGRELVAGGFTIAQLTALTLIFLGLFGAFGGYGKPPVDVSWQAPSAEESR